VAETEAKAEQKPEQEAEASETELEPSRAAEMIDSGGADLIDIRTDDEHDAGRIEGERHIEFTELPAHADEIDRELPVIFYCRGGNRSGMTAAAFRADGYSAFHIKGGIVAWVDAGLPIEGEVVEHKLVHE
jgi:rhodanese-related sulfurtransferase